MLQLIWNWVAGMPGEHGQQPGVSAIGEWIAAGRYSEACIKVAVGEVILNGVVVIQG